jgi:hypothetical protein
MDDLPARVHSGVGTPGHRQLRRSGQPQHPAERRGQFTLHRAPTRLGRPAGKL